MQSILDNIVPISYVLGKNRKTHLILTDSDTARMKLIITLLKPFKECGEKLFAVSLSADHSIFDFEDDASMDDNIPRIEIDNIPAEIRQYRSVAMSREFKENCNVL